LGASFLDSHWKEKPLPGLPKGDKSKVALARRLRQETAMSLKWMARRLQRLAIMANPAFLEKIRQVCRAHLADPRAQRYHFWMHYAEEHVAA